MSVVLVCCLVAAAAVVAAPWLVRRPPLPLSRATVAAAVAIAAGIGLVVAGPVAATVVVIYGALGGRALLRRGARRRAVALRAIAVAGLGGLAADLRAGLPPSRGVLLPGRLGELTSSVWRLAETTGAPAADLVERIEADARAADRAARSAAAQAAGAQATATLLAALPLGGIGLGYVIGADPLRVLLHTPSGAACAIGAAGLQTAGLLWSERLTRTTR